MTLGGAEVDACMAVRGNLGPVGNIGWRGMNGIWGCTAWLLPYPEVLGCEGEADITCCLLLPMLLLTMGEATPGRVVCDVTPAGPNRADTMRALSEANLCLAFSTCSHSFMSNVSTSANCFSFSSNLFNWETDLKPVYLQYNWKVKQNRMFRRSPKVWIFNGSSNYLILHNHMKSIWTKP